MLSLPFVERDSNVGEEPGLEREGAQEQLGGTGGGVQGGMYVIPAITTLCPSGLRGVDSRSTSASCVGSNPTGVAARGAAVPAQVGIGGGRPPVEVVPRAAAGSQVCGTQLLS